LRFALYAGAARAAPALPLRAERNAVGPAAAWRGARREQPAGLRRQGLPLRTRDSFLSLNPKA